ncbi:glutathione S-transferase family protein [Martelella alba]|uniref:Glutathione S-transferase family protein n=1 Tax=Martelella alba TaxID=2590451 RepID=A0ABY2SPG0_9HYPH|nr:glutathione S-transferase family protein [Martelella alba]TKI07824.1 glutathione S-transferase family protein [Martelella alba]
MYKLLGRATSGNVQKVVFLLQELGADYRREDYGRQFGNTATPEYAALNPTGKVPTLIDGSLVIWESNTILRYLAATAGSPLYPADPGQRTLIERWMDWLLASLNPAYLGGFRDAKKTPDQWDANTRPALISELNILEGHLSAQPWLAGEAFSLADIALGPIVGRCVKFPFDLPPFPALAGWIGKLEQRPAFQIATRA